MTLSSSMGSGLNSGLRSGLNASAAPSLLASVDGPSSWYRPITDAEWTALAGSNSKISIPTRYYLCQDASGGPAEKNGGTSFTTNGTRVYQQAVTGWTALAIGQAGTGSDGWYHNTAVGTNPNTTSVAWLIYAAWTKPAATRLLLTIANETSLQMTSAGKLLARLNSVNGTLASVDHSDIATVRAVLAVYKVGVGVTFYTNLEQVNGPAWVSAPSDGPKGVYPTGGQAAASRVLYIAQWAGAAAEALDKTVLATLTRATLPY